MSAETISEVKKEEVPQQAASQSSQNQNNNPPEEKQQEQESSKDINWKAFKKARDEERKQSEEIAKQAKKSQEEASALKAALDAVLNKPNHQEQRSEEQEEDEEKRIERKVNELLAKKEVEYEKKRQERDLEELPKRLNSDFKDFEQVCSSDNLDYLDYHYPEVTRAFAHMPQGYERWSCIYKAAKKFVPNTNSTKEAAKAERNFQKPQSSSSPGMTHTGEPGHAIRLDEKRKAENYARMQRVMNKLGD